MTVAEQVQATAFVAAAARAAETAKRGGRISDDYAQRFVDAQEHGGAVRRRILAAGADEVVHRTVLLDALLAAAVSGREDYAVINLGAGFCARPYRLDLSGCRQYIEVDAAPVLDVKNRVLDGDEPSCPVHRVVGDVRDGEAIASIIAAHGLGSGHTIVLSEGLLVYLPAAEVTALARGLRTALASGRWLCDVVSVDSAAGMATVAGGARAGVSLYGLADLDVIEHGWSVTDYRPLPVSRRSPVPTSSRAVLDGVLALDTV